MARKKYADYNIRMDRDGDEVTIYQDTPEGRVQISTTREELDNCLKGLKRGQELILEQESGGEIQEITLTKEHIGTALELLEGDDMGDSVKYRHHKKPN